RSCQRSAGIARTTSALGRRRPARCAYSRASSPWLRLPMTPAGTAGNGRHSDLRRTRLQSLLSTSFDLLFHCEADASPIDFVNVFVQIPCLSVQLAIPAKPGDPFPVAVGRGQAVTVVVTASPGRFDL